VRAVLFYSPACPHCQQLITQDLPPLFEKYGNRLQIIGVDTYTQGGQALFKAAVQSFQVPEDSWVVPILFIGDRVLIGGRDIPEQLPGLIDEYLAQGGVDWPNIPGLREALAASQTETAPTTEPTAPSTTPTLAEPDEETDVVTPEIERTPTGTSVQAVALTPNPGPADPGLILPDPHALSLTNRLALDPLGNGLSIVVLTGMVLSFGGAAALLLNSQISSYPEKHSWAIPVLCLIGFVIAGYLTYVETQQVTAVCGPVGDCNTVQQSEYAILFGVLPVGVLGLLGYVAISIAWVLSRYAKGRIADLASAALLGMSLFGVIFSIYLTFLEPFVIGATCAWCLSSAVIITVLLWLAVRPGRLALARLSSAGKPTSST
jgi:uncharacterized membrane protein